MSVSADADQHPAREGHPARENKEIRKYKTFLYRFIA